LNYFHNWMSRRRMSGGLLLQKGSHDIDLINWISGATPIRVSCFAGLDHFGGDADPSLHCRECEKVDTCLDSWTRKNPQEPFLEGKRPYVAAGARCAYSREIDVFDNHLVNILYDSGMKASYNECHFTPISRRHFVFIGELGQVTADSLDNTTTLIRREHPEPEVFGVSLDEGGHGGGDTGLMGDLRRCLLEGAAPVADATAGFLSILVAEAGERSAIEGRIVDLSEPLKRFAELRP
jgi:predicted dehydrogenase